MCETWIASVAMLVQHGVASSQVSHRTSWLWWLHHLRVHVHALGCLFQLAHYYADASDFCIEDFFSGCNRPYRQLWSPLDEGHHACVFHMCYIILPLCMEAYYDVSVSAVLRLYRSAARAF